MNKKRIFVKIPEKNTNNQKINNSINKMVEYYYIYLYLYVYDKKNEFFIK